ncbi:MAG TPA: hypothetical protein VEH84_01430, partial [Alphaproteobacteria bacterium]|nr:hypothetical protein [Alphaproteobacteria bacterium]
MVPSKRRSLAHSVVRPATAADLPDVVDIHVGCWVEVYTPFMPESALASRGRDFRQAQWEAWFQSPAGALFVLELDGRVEGFTHIVENEDTEVPAAVDFKATYIRPAGRGGIACPLLLHHATAWAAGRGLESAVLWAFRDNGTRVLHTRVGWEPAINRDRPIAGYPIPEIGYLHGSTSALRQRYQ